MTTVPLPSDTGTDTHLSGWWVWLVRGVWLSLTLLVVGMAIASVPVRYEQLHSRCEVAPCPPSVLSQEAVDILAANGISLDQYALAWVVPETLTLLFYLPIVVLVVWRRSDDWMAFLVSVALLLWGVGTLPLVAALSDLSLNLELAVAVLALLTEILFVLLLFVFPDGRMVPRWSKWFIALFFVISITNALIREQGFGIEAVIPILIGLLVGVIAQIYRYRNVSGPVARQQTKWAVVGFVTYVGTLFIVIIPTVLFPSINAAATVIHSSGQLIYLAVILPMIYVSTYALPLFFAVALLRYRLWDVDFIINRGLVYGVTTVLLLGVFGLGFFLLQSVLSNVLGSNSDVIAAVIPAVIATALFNPARRRLRDLVDRRFYGIQIIYATPPPRVRDLAAHIERIGDYTDLHLVATGGMGEVYRAMHPTLNRSVAIKILSTKLANEPEFRKRFEREAEVVTTLQHPNIVQIFEFWQKADVAYMVMEFIEGIDLAQMIRRTGALKIEQVLPILDEVASALDYAHQQGVVHRDIKPSNVMMEPIRGSQNAYRAVLMDFGIAKIATGGTRLTFSGTIGTLDYIAPEQIQGASDVDHHADIYSLGVMTYQMLTGRLPFTKNNPGALLLAHLMEPAPNACSLVDDLPSSVGLSLQRAMSKQPADRFPSAGAFVAAIY